MASLRRALDSLATRSLQTFFAAGPALLSCFVAFGVWIILDSRQQAWDRAALSLSNVTALIEHNLARNIDILDLYVQSAIRSFGIPGIGQFEPDVRQTLLFDGSTRLSHVGSIFIAGAAGEYIYESLGVTPRQISVSQRDYFTVHRDQPGAGLYISSPLRLQDKSSWAIVLSRRLPSRNGSFSGIAAGSLTLDYFDKLVSDLHLTSQDMLTLLR